MTTNSRIIDLARAQVRIAEALADKSEHLQACMAYRIAAGLYSQVAWSATVKVVEACAYAEEVLAERAGK